MKSAILDCYRYRYQFHYSRSRKDVDPDQDVLGTGPNNFFQLGSK